MVANNAFWLANPGGGSFYNDVATTSVRFDSSADANLNEDFSGAGSRVLWTFSTWFKRSKLTDGTLFAAYASASVRDCIRVLSNVINFQLADGSETYNADSTGLLRDTSAWYHLVVQFNSADNTETNRTKMWINGLPITLAESGDGIAAKDVVSSFGNDKYHSIGARRTSGTDNNLEFDGYMADTHYVNGAALDYTSFAEFKNGVLIPKAYSGSYGTNGFYFKYDKTGDGSSTASSSTIGADISGQTNHFKDSNLDAFDSAMPDSPENNFATWNPIYRVFGDSGFLAPTNGALHTKGSGDVNADRAYAMSTIAINEVLRNSDGAGVYMEIRRVAVGGDNGYLGLFGRQGFDQKADGLARSDNTGYSHHHLISPNGRTLLEGGQSSSDGDLNGLDGAQSSGGVIGFAVKSDGKFFISVNGTFSTNVAGATQNPVTGANPFGTIDLDIDFFLHAGNISEFQANFGQDSTFGGNETVTTNADANGIGAFHTAPPTGYLALCSANMAEPTIGPNSDTQATDHFDTLLYTGNGQTAAQGSKAVTGLAFKPDWVWLKKRDNAGADVDHAQYDSIRGINSAISTSTTGDENTFSNQFRSFDAPSDTPPTNGGFTVVLADDGSFGLNRNNSPFVAWNWKANGGTATATISESGANPAAVVQANPTAGFSIIKYTGTGGAGTIAHGLGAVPQMMIFKTLDEDGNSWIIYHGDNTAEPETDFLAFSNAATTDNANRFNDTAPTSTNITIGADGNINQDGQANIAYIFAEVKGYSRMGSYIGTGVAAGPFIYLGFRPAWIMTKEQSASGENWIIWDNKRDTNNPNNVKLFADTNGAETNETDTRMVDFLSNGFKLRTAHDSHNGSQTTHIYMAFAETPFKYANAK